MNQPASEKAAVPAPNSKTASVQQQKSAPAKNKLESAPPVTANTPPPQIKEEKPPIVQSAHPAPAPVPDSPAPAAAPERKPAASTPASVAESTAPAPQPAVSSAPRDLVPAAPLSQASPIFPELALRTRTSGTVVLELQIDEQGKVVKATPISGPAIFYNAATSAAMKWRYKPASIGGVNVRSQSIATMDFKLKK
jgi:protein TonB